MADRVAALSSESRQHPPVSPLQHVPQLNLASNDEAVYADQRPPSRGSSRARRRSSSVGASNARPSPRGFGRYTPRFDEPSTLIPGPGAYVGLPSPKPATDRARKSFGGGGALERRLSASSLRRSVVAQFRGGDLGASDSIASSSLRDASVGSNGALPGFGRQSPRFDPVDQRSPGPSAHGALENHAERAQRRGSVRGSAGFVREGSGSAAKRRGAYERLQFRGGDSPGPGGYHVPGIAELSQVRAEASQGPAFGRYAPRFPDDRTLSPGPGAYSPPADSGAPPTNRSGSIISTSMRLGRSTASASTGALPGFGRQSPRFEGNSTHSPGPGAYGSLENHAERAQRRGSVRGGAGFVREGSGSAAKRRGAYERLQFRGGDSPGPGGYNVPSKFEESIRRTIADAVTAALPAGLADSRRSVRSQGSTTAPGFGRNTPRFPEPRHHVPGPGEYGGAVSHGTLGATAVDRLRAGPLSLRRASGLDPGVQDTIRRAASRPRTRPTSAGSGTSRGRSSARKGAGGRDASAPQPRPRSAGPRRPASAGAGSGRSPSSPPARGRSGGAVAVPGFGGVTERFAAAQSVRRTTHLGPGSYPDSDVYALARKAQLARERGRLTARVERAAAVRARQGPAPGTFADPGLHGVHPACGRHIMHRSMNTARLEFAPSQTPGPGGYVVPSTFDRAYVVAEDGAWSPPPGAGATSPRALKPRARDRDRDRSSSGLRLPPGQDAPLPRPTSRSRSQSRSRQSTQSSQRRSRPTRGRNGAASAEEEERRRRREETRAYFGDRVRESLVSLGKQPARSNGGGARRAAKRSARRPVAVAADVDDDEPFAGVTKAASALLSDGQPSPGSGRDASYLLA